MEDKYYFNLHSFNMELKDQLKQVTTEKEVNNMVLFVKNDDAKVSVTLEAKFEKKNDYHGLSPKFDEVKLKEFLFRTSNGVALNNQDNFWRKIKAEQNQHKYMKLLVREEWTKNQKQDLDVKSSHYLTSDEMLETLLGRAVLQMTTHFGFTIQIPESYRIRFIQILKECFKGILVFPKVFKKDDFKNNLYWQFNDDYSSIYIKGIWPISAVKKLTKWYDYHENTLILRSSLSKRSNEFFNLLTFNESYEDKYHNSFDNVYYSGVMPKVLHIRYDDKPTAADKMKYIVFEVARTTFATLDMFDNPAILSHPFFKSISDNLNRFELMKDFDEHEDKIQEAFLYKPEYDPESDKNETNIFNSDRITLSPSIISQRKYEEYMILNLNEYLARSLNSNTVAVSANIVTKDDYLLIGKRGKLTIDNDQYYCSVNGQSEFRDSNVSFYRNSVFEDLPSMEFDSTYRIDLNNEIQRESLAELGLPFFEREWSYYGISYLSVNNTAVINKQKPVMKRRMHFNVLTHNSTSYTFADVNKSQKKATESFENERLRGLKIKVHPNLWTLLLSLGRTIIEHFIKYKSNIFILYFILSLVSPSDGIMNFGEPMERLSITEITRMTVNNIMNLGTKNLIDIFILVFFLFTSTIEIIRYGPIRKLLSTKNFMIKFHRCEYITDNDLDQYDIKWKRIYDIITEKNLLSGYLNKKIFRLRKKYDESSLKMLVKKGVKRLHIIIWAIRYPFENIKQLNKLIKWISKEVSYTRAYIARNEINRVHGIVYIMYSLHFYEKVKTMKNPFFWPIIRRYRFKFINDLLSAIVIYFIAGLILLIVISFCFPDI